jgi:hypothetical protein
MSGARSPARAWRAPADFCLKCVAVALTGRCPARGGRVLYLSAPGALDAASALTRSVAALRRGEPSPGPGPFSSRF